jgi:hypothetical protein
MLRNVFGYTKHIGFTDEFKKIKITLMNWKYTWFVPENWYS